MVALELFERFNADKAAKEMADKIQVDLKAGKDAQKVLDLAIASLQPKAVKGAAQGAAAGAKKDPRDAASVGEDRPDTDPARPQIVATASFNRGGEPVQGLTPEANAKVVRFAFGAKDKDGMDEVLRNDQGFVLVSLKEHKAATKDEFAKDKEVYLQTLVRQKQDEAFALYMSRLKAASKNEISIDEAYLAAKLGTPKAATDGGAPVPTPAQEDEDDGP